MTANPEALAQQITSPETLDNNLVQCTLCICYPIQFAGDYSKVLIDFRSEVHVITSVFITTFAFTTRTANIEAQKIDGSFFKIYGMVLTRFSIWDNLVRI